MAVTDSQGKNYYKPEPIDRQARNVLGGSTVPVSASLLVIDQPAGAYTMKVTVTEGKETATFSKEFAVLPKEFGLAAITTSVDSGGRVLAPAGGVVGESRWVHCNVVGFARDKQNQTPNIYLEISIVDEKGQTMMPKPAPFSIKEAGGPDVFAIPVHFGVDFNRPGKFTAELRATDKVSKKTAKITIPITVLDRYPAAKASE
jgi:hypothetical protein